ncbi:MAG: FkbM family methyltransferase [Alphaproteobacteria bacterium]|nr:FkbM family methyltransferase [Alphaproteobacteria bacterium]
MSAVVDAVPWTREERVVNALIPPRLYWRVRAWRGWWKGEAELRLLRHLIDPRRNAVDAGANKGVYTYFLARHARHCFAYEPNPKIHAILDRACRGANATVAHAALSNQPGRARLMIPIRGGRISNQTASLRADLVAKQDHLAVEVEARRLDDEPVGDVGFIKIDVEGFERAVIEGARATIERCRPTLLVEIEEKNTGEPPEAVIAWIESLGYRALCMRAGVLATVSSLDLKAEMAAGRYIYNFVFLPR